MSMIPIAPDQIMQLALGFCASKTLLSAVELGVFTTLAEAPLDADTLRDRLGLHARGARDFFDTLVSLGMLQRTDGRYSNTAVTDLYLDRSKPSYVGGFLEMINDRLYRFWGDLTEALRTGEPQNEAKQGLDGFEGLYADPDRLKLFLSGMTGISMGPSVAIAQKFPWPEYGTFIDVGCAQGALPVQVAQRHAHITGGGFDLPIVGPLFEEYVASFGLGDRLRFEAGDFFNGAMPQADVLAMGHILHDWNLERKHMLLRKAYNALPAGGALIVYDAILDEGRSENTLGLLLSLNMLIETPGGFEYTGGECMEWMRDVGFTDTRIEHLAGPESMVIGIK